MTSDTTIAKAAVDLILQFEGFTGKVDYPGGMSGPTWGIGYDGGYHSVGEIRRDWTPYLPPLVVDRLIEASGARGARNAKRVVADLQDIIIPRAAADAVFMRVDIPRWIQRAARAFPGYEVLPDEVQGALVSLVFNRGAKMSDGNSLIEERREMRGIRDAVENVGAPLSVKCAEIARNLRAMSRLWTGELPAPYNVKLRGLLRRREMEAQLVERAARGNNVNEEGA